MLPSCTPDALRKNNVSICGGNTSRQRAAITTRPMHHTMSPVCPIPPALGYGSEQ